MAKYRITGPDGANYEVDAPDENALNAAVEQMFGAAQAPAEAPAPIAPAAPLDAPAASPDAPAASAPPAERGWLDAIMDVGGQGLSTLASGVNTGMANIAGLPVDAINNAPRLLNLLPGVSDVGPITSDPFGGSESFKRGMRSVGAIQPTPEGMGYGITNRIGEEIGANMLPLGFILNKARMGVEAARELPSLGRMFIEPAAVNPAKFARNEMTAATAAGTGAGLANQAVDRNSEWGPLADFGGALGGVGLASVGNSVLRAASDVGRSLFGNGSYADEVVRDAVMRKVAEAGGITAAPGQEPDLTPLIRAAENGQRVGDVIPGYTDSLADRTRNPGLAGLEYSRQSGPNAGSYAQRRAENTQAIDAAMGQAAPDPAATPGQFRSALDTARDEVIGTAAARTGEAQTAYDAATAGLTPLMTAEGRGASIRTALEDANERARRVLSEAWAPINEAQGASVPMRPLAESFAEADAAVPRALQGNIPAASRVPGTFVDDATEGAATGLLDANGRPIRAADVPGVDDAALSEVMGVRSALSNERLNLPPDSQEVRLINERIARLDSYLDQNMPAELRQQYDAARAATVDYKDRFSRPQTGIGQTLATRQGQPRGPDSSVPGRFVQSDEGNIANFESMMREAGSDARVQSAVRDQVLSDVRDRGLLNNPQGLQDYLNQYGTVFERFPQLRDELGNAGNLRRELDAARGSEESLRSTLTQQGRSNVANYLSYADERAGQAMKNVLAARDPAGAADELLTFVGDNAQAVEGARKAFWDVLQERSRAGGRTTANVDGAQPWSPAALSQFLDNPANAAVADRLWRANPEHLQRIREIADTLRGVDLRNAAKAPNTSGTGQSSSFNSLLTPETLQSRWYAYSSGRVSGSFLLTSIISTLVRRGVRRAQEQGFQRMLDDVVQNADTAALLMRQNNPANRAALSRKAKTWFGNEASTIVNDLGSGANQDDTNDAIMREDRK